jgi:hypothetical protein
VQGKSEDPKIYGFEISFHVTDVNPDAIFVHRAGIKMAKHHHISLRFRGDLLCELLLHKAEAENTSPSVIDDGGVLYITL